MKTVAHSTDDRAVRAFGTVKKRMRMCGSPAVPNISASASDRPDKGSLTSWRGASTATPAGCRRTAWASSASASKPNRDRTSAETRTAPTSNSTALTICTQLVATMPPSIT